MRPDIEAIEGRWGHEQTILNGDFVLEKANRDIALLIAYVRELEARHLKLQNDFDSFVESMNVDATEQVQSEMATLRATVARLSAQPECPGEKLRTAREAAGMTQMELSQKSGVQQGHISRIECGVFKPTQETINKLASAMNLSAEQIFQEQVSLLSENLSLRATVSRLEAKCRQQQQEMMAIQTELSRSVVQ